MAYKRFLTVSLLSAALFVSCTKNGPDAPPEPGGKEAPRLVQKVNDFIWTIMGNPTLAYYLWAEDVPKNINRKYEENSKSYFDKLLYKAEDKWSFITDDYERVSEGSEGVETTFGYSLAFGRFTGTDYYFGIVQFVYPDTPAAKAGLKRGDIIIRMNGNYIDANNYRRLFNDPSLSIQLGILSEGGISPGNTITLTAVKMQLSMIIAEKVLEIEGKKIGYLSYSNFFGGSDTELNGVFGRFNAAGVEDVVLDLRYNTGGYTHIAAHLASILAPASVVNAERVLITYRWNASYQAFLEEQRAYDDLRVLFKKSVPVNLDLSRLFVLTTGSTASASEFVITGLDPYMEVIKIGTPTSGKYTGSILFHAARYWNGRGWEVDQEIKNWGVQPIVMRYANSLGVTDFKTGFIPDYKVDDLLLEGVCPLGDPQEPLLGKALELITGVSFATAVPVTKSGFEIDRSLSSRNDYLNGSVLVRKIE